MPLILMAKIVELTPIRDCKFGDGYLDLVHFEGNIIPVEIATGDIPGCVVDVHYGLSSTAIELFH